MVGNCVGRTSVGQINSVHANVLSDDWAHRRRRKRGHENGKECEPNDVEGSHVWLGERVDLDLESLVLGVDRQIKLGLFMRPRTLEIFRHVELLTDFSHSLKGITC